ncbi:hypothetical protein [Lacrimispora saccharolytica]|uniref:hypothetical protein n=1 Tax=Lacrimispora saccharolytica TaxID=84030 RepID=UPI00265D30DB|nr:hypothetical protein [Lacrimispora saccharolytica]MCF2657075.1 hypothetical protein [Lacrimispora saccharolytica]
MIAYKVMQEPGFDEKLMMMFHQIIYVFLTVEAAIYNKLEFPKFKEINILNKVLYCLNISDVNSKFPVVNSEH